MAIGKTKAFNTHEMERILMNNGFECTRHKGDHRIWKRNDEVVVLNRRINKMVARRILKENNIKFR